MNQNQKYGEKQFLTFTFLIAKVYKEKKLFDHAFSILIHLSRCTLKVFALDYEVLRKDHFGHYLQNLKTNSTHNKNPLI